MNPDRKKLIAGICLLSAGILLIAVGAHFFFGSLHREEFSPVSLFAPAGALAAAAGIIFLFFAFRRDIEGFAAEKAPPVLDELARETRSTVDAAVSAVREGLKEKIACPVCGQKNDAGALFCRCCGTRLEKECPVCRQKNAADAVFCRHCGIALKKTCPHCGATLKPDALFCDRCGERL